MPAHGSYPVYTPAPATYEPYPPVMVGGPWPPGAPEPRRRSLTWLWVGLVVLLVLGAGGVIVVVAVGRAMSDKGQASAPTTAPATPAQTTPAAEPTTEPAVQTITLPSKLAGLTQTNRAEFSSIINGMVDQMKTNLPGSTGIGAAFYTDNKSAQKIVMVVQVKGDFHAPSLEVEGVFAGLGTSGVNVTSIRTIDTGSIDGISKCGKATLSSVPVAVCTWADDKGIGMTFFYFRTINESTSLFKNIRKELDAIG
ncbi:MAG: hypothetical protein ACM30G_10405 [Micromonosporaceae bacterium]